MMNDILGEDVFIRGVIDFLNTHREGNANSDDLWAALTEVLKIKV